MFIKTRLVQGLLLAFGGTAAVWSPGAFAQDASPTATQEPQRVTVTGSNIRRTDTETPSPIQVITADDIKQSGYTSVADVLQSITANGQGTLSQGFSGAFASGAAGVSLRGLTTAYTLVLIDGHRSAPYPIGDDGQRSFVDIANIPFESVERIEVLKDGASAIYGSDAVAGVVNIILKRNYTGATVGGEVGVAKGNTGAERRANASWGTGDLNKDGHNFYIAVEGRTQDQIRYIDRGNMYNKTDYTSQGGGNGTRGVPDQTVNGGFAGSSTGYVVGPDGSTIAFMPGCNLTTYNAGQCSYKNTWSQIQPNTAKFNAVSRLTLNLPADWQASFEGTFFQSKAQQVGSPSASQNAGYQGITSGPGVTPSLLPTIVNTISSTNPSFPAGAPFTTGPLTYNFLDLGPTVTDTDAKTTRLVADAEGSFLGWDLQGAVGYTQATLQILGRGYVNPYNLQTSLDSTTDPYLVGQKNSAEVDAFIAPTLVANDISKLEFFHLDASHDIMPLQGGALSVSAGYDFVHRVQDATAPEAVANGTTPNFSNNYTIGYQTVNSVFAEIHAPVLKSLDVDGAVRYDHYNLSGGKASPKLGFKWTPVEQFALRGTASKGFRAPGPAENGTAGQTFFTGNTSDPDLCKTDSTTGNQLIGSFPTQCSIAVGTVQSTNAKLKPETSKSFTFGTILEPIKNYSASIDYYSIEIDNQIVAGNSEVAVRGTNLTPIPQVVGFNADGTPITQLAAPPEGTIAYESVTYVNANKTTTSGFDIDLQAKQHIGAFGDFKSDFGITWMTKYDQTINGITYKLAGTHGPLVVGGDTGSPRTRIQWANSITHGDGELTATMNYISGYSYADPSFSGGIDCANAIGFGAAAAQFSAFTGNDQVPPGIACKVGSFFTFDLAGHYDVTKHFAVHASILNLFDKQAPLDFATYGGGAAPYNPSLHQQGAIGRFATVGANYTF